MAEIKQMTLNDLHELAVDLFRALTEVSYNNIVLEVLVESLAHVLLFSEGRSQIFYKVRDRLAHQLHGKECAEVESVLTQLVETLQAPHPRLKEVESRLNRYAVVCTKALK